MSSGGGKSGNEVTEESIPDWIRFPAIRNLQRAEDVQRIEYMPYRGAEVAGFTDNQIAAFQNNNNAATAFGLQAPTNAMSGMPTPELYANGMRGYSSMPLYDQALAETKKAQPDAVAQYDSLFGSNVGTTYNPYPTGSPNSSSGGGGNNAVDPNMLAIQKLRDDRDNAVIPPVNYNTSGSGSNPFGYLDNVPKSPPGGGLGKYFTADNMDAFGSAIGGLGQLASGWAALKNIGLQRDAYDTMKNQWERNYGDQTTVANNMIADRNAWRNANNMTTTANYVGGQAPGKNYAG